MTTNGPATLGNTRPKAFAWRRSRSGRRRDVVGTILTLPTVALLVLLFLVPLGIFAVYSFYSLDGSVIVRTFTLSTYQAFWDSYYGRMIVKTLEMAGLATVFTLAVSYPLAYMMAIARSGVIRVALGVITFLPLTVVGTVRAYSWQVLLTDQGPVNKILHAVGLHPQLVFNMTGIVIAMVQIFLPFAVFPIYGSLSAIDRSLREASADLGADWKTTFRRVVLPLSIPGTAAAAEITFTLSLGSFVVPSMLGGGRVVVLPLTIYNDTLAVNWPMAAVLGLVLMALSLLALVLLHQVGRYAQR